MKWILVVITAMAPNVPVSEIRMEFDTEQQCLDQQYALEEMFTEAETEFTYHIYCFDELFELENEHD